MSIKSKTSRAAAPLVLAAIIAAFATAGAGRPRAAEAAAALDRAAPLDRRWYTPHELLPRLAERDGLRWAMPETLAGLALIGGDPVTARAALDDACRQWGLIWAEADDGVVTVHRGDRGQLRRWTALLEGGGKAAQEAAWELGWLCDARAVAPLADALAKAADEDPALALAAAKAVETLLADVPLGRTDRVDPRPPGRVSLAAGFPPAVDVSPLLDSPYPPVRAAALRLLLGVGGRAADEAEAKTAADRSVLVRRVRQQMLVESPPLPPEPADGAEAFGPEGPRQVPEPPADPAALARACETMVSDIPGLAKESQWEQMRWRARVLAGWSRAGSDTAADALIRMGRTEEQSQWFPEYVHRQLAATGGPKATDRLREVFAADAEQRDTIVRGLEEAHWGDGLLSFTRPHLGEQTVCYVATRNAGREAYDDLLALAAKSGERDGADGEDGGFYFPLDCLSVVGGPRAVGVLRDLLNHDEPGSGTLAFRAAKALGDVGTADALAALLEAADSPDRFRRHAAVLFLGRIGGPAAEEKLVAIVGDETDRFVRTAAADALEQVGTERALAAAVQFREADAGLPALTYAPRNERFGGDFPVNEWVDTQVRIRAYAAYGEMGWNYDAANRLFFRYGGCSGYTNELTLFDPGTGRFVQRRPNEEMAGWGDRRPPRGCSGGRCWDPHRKVAWIGPAIGGGEPDVAIAEYYNRGGRSAGRDGYSFCSYDLATDEFRPADYREVVYGEPPKRFVYDRRGGLLIPVKFSPFPDERPFWALDTRAADPWSDPEAAWQDRTSAADQPYPRLESGYACAAVDQDAGLLVMYVPPSALTKGKPQTWVYDPRTGAWTDARPAEQPRGVSGGGFAYDPFHRVLLLQSGRKETQFGGPGDSITWSYDVRSNTWTDLNPENGPGNAWVGAMDFDAEHNVFLLFNHRTGTVWAYRYGDVPRGTSVAPTPDGAEAPTRGNAVRPEE
jgi:hypothetical protein